MKACLCLGLEDGSAVVSGIAVREVAFLKCTGLPIGGSLGRLTVGLESYPKAP